jgi:hypothetical protein
MLHGSNSSHTTDDCQTLQEQASWIKEAWNNVSLAERSHQKCKREQQKQKEQNELHEIDMFQQPNQHHHLDDNFNINKAHHVEEMENITVSECFNLSDLCQPPTS